MSQKNIVVLKDALSILLSLITVASIIFYGGKVVQAVDDHEKRITRIETDLYFNNADKK